MIKVLKNDTGGIFFAKLILSEDEARVFLKSMWGELNPQIAQTDDILVELTDRAQNVRTRYKHNELIIYSHGWTSEQDKETLPGIVLRHLIPYTNV